jgi:DNA-binding response OmpR family regulator
LYEVARVRALLLSVEERELPFVEALLATFATHVIRARVVPETLSLPAIQNAELIVIALDDWREEDAELCSRLRASALSIPLLGLSGLCALGERARALQAGADEFLSIPFEVEELVVRATALVRRASLGSRRSQTGAFLVDFGRRQVFVEGRSILLTLHEYDVLATLIERAGQVVTRQELAARAASMAARDSNVVDVHVSRIREKLGAYASTVETVRGLGYRFRGS